MIIIIIIILIILLNQWLLQDLYLVCFGVFPLLPGESGHSQVMAKHGVQTSVLSPDTEVRGGLGVPPRARPSWNEGPGWLDTDHARQWPPPAPFPSSSVNGPVGSMWKPPSLGTCVQTPSARRSQPLPASKSMLPSRFCLSRLYTLAPSLATQGGGWRLGLPPLFPLPSFLLRPSVRICLLRPPLDWGWPSGAWDTTKDKSLQNQM